jgi:cell division protein FtsW
MTTVRTFTDPAPAAEAARPAEHRPLWGTLFGSLRAVLDRPLTSYYLLLIAPAVLLTIGLVMVLSASSVEAFRDYDDSYYWVRRQLVWVAVGLPIAWVSSRLSIRWIRRLAWPGLFFAIGLLGLTLTPLGITVNGNTNWVGVGPFQLQPSEFAKLGLVLWLAHLYANKERRLGEIQHVLVPALPAVAVVVGLVLWQRDLGTALVLLAITMGMLWVIGAPGRLFTLGMSVASVGALYLATTNSERRGRLLSFTDPFKDYLDTGWQPAHGLYALSSGGWFGEGLGASRQKWGDLYGAHTDYIFAVLGEELGLIGTGLVLVLFLTIAYAAVRVASSTEDAFVRYASFGIVVWLLGQMAINVGMVLSLLPVIGIPLPLVSYGGSALLPSLVAVALLVGFARREPEAARALAMRRRARASGVSARARSSADPA